MAIITEKIERIEVNNPKIKLKSFSLSISIFAILNNCANIKVIKATRTNIQLPYQDIGVTLVSIYCNGTQAIKNKDAQNREILASQNAI